MNRNTKNQKVNAYLKRDAVTGKGVRYSTALDNDGTEYEIVIFGKSAPRAYANLEKLSSGDAIEMVGKWQYNSFKERDDFIVTVLNKVDIEPEPDSEPEFDWATARTEVMEPITIGGNKSDVLSFLQDGLKNPVDWESFAVD